MVFTGPVALDLCGGSIFWREHTAGVTYLTSWKPRRKETKTGALLKTPAL